MKIRIPDQIDPIEIISDRNGTITIGDIPITYEDAVHLFTHWFDHLSDEKKLSVISYLLSAPV